MVNEIVKKHKNLKYQQNFCSNLELPSMTKMFRFATFVKALYLVFPEIIALCTMFLIK